MPFKTVPEADQKKARIRYFRRGVRQRVWETYVRDLHETLGLNLSGEVSDSELMVSLNEMMAAIIALDREGELGAHLKRAELIILDRVLRDIHNLEDPNDPGVTPDWKILADRATEEAEPRVTPFRDGTAEGHAQPTGAGCDDDRAEPHCAVASAD
jgi:hypothetical protein